MIIVFKPDASDHNVEHVVERLRSLGLRSQVTKGEERVVVGVIGDERVLQGQPLSVFPGVESVTPILAPWKIVSREFQRHDSVIDVGGVQIGGARVVVMAGPCAVEKLEMTMGIAKAVAQAGARILRGGAYKPRTSPYSFQGLGQEGLEFLAAARHETRLPVVSEILDVRDMGHSQPATGICKTLNCSRKWGRTINLCC